MDTLSNDTNNATIPAPSNATSPDSPAFQWTAANVCLSLFLFTAAGFAEISGGWLVWKDLRESKPWWWALIGSVVLVIYGFIPTFQPINNFGRVFGVYGGVFIVLSYGWGWLFDGLKPDVGDFVGASLALVGVTLAWFWPR